MTNESLNDCRKQFEEFAGVKISELVTGSHAHAQWCAWQAAIAAMEGVYSVPQSSAVKPEPNGAVSEISRPVSNKDDNLAPSNPSEMLDNKPWVDELASDSCAESFGFDKHTTYRIIERYLAAAITQPPEPVSVEAAVKSIDKVAKIDGWTQTIKYDPAQFAAACAEAWGLKCK